jgi:hypothetical protein
VAGKIAVLITLFTMVGACQLRNSFAVPTELVGVWKADDAKYEDRFFEITPTNIFLGLGDGYVEAQTIVGVEEVRERDAALHTISYRSQDGQESRLSFYYDRRDAGVIRFKHQRNIQWTKARS